MKNFFEFIGFSATALLAGFLVFSYVGKQKNASAPSASLLTEMNSEQEDSEQPRMKTISGKKSKGAAASDNERVSAAPSPRNTPAAPADANVEEKLRTLLDNRSIVESLAAKWKQPVANAADENTNKAAALLAHAIIQSYLGVYTARDLQRDAVAHAGDQVKSPENAAKGYPYAWSVGKLMSRYNLQQLYPAPPPPVRTAAAKVVTRPATAASGSNPVAAKISKPVAQTPPGEAGVREMVARENGFSSWSGLQRLADAETKKKAEKRFKSLMMATRIK